MRIWAGSHLTDGIAMVLPAPVEGEVTILPSSLDRRDRVLAATRTVLRASGGTSRVLLPLNPIAALGRQGEWSEVKIEVPDAGPRRVRLPSALIAADTLWTVTDVDAVSGRGPYALDLIARYLTPIDRLRLLGGSTRSATAEVTLARRPDFCLVTRVIAGGHLLVATTDVVAAELMALALVDEDLLQEHRLTGPWEDDLVQRATELDLGVRLPQEIRVDVVGDMPEAVSSTVARVLSRIGIITG